MFPLNCKCLKWSGYIFIRSYPHLLTIMHEVNRIIRRIYQTVKSDHRRADSLLALSNCSINVLRLFGAYLRASVRILNLKT
jgi:hypothetical protein